MAASAAMSCTTPISLFTVMTVTSSVGTSSAARSTSGSSSPSGRTGRNTGSNPSAARSATDSSTHLCSVATVTMRRRSLPAKRAAPLIAMLLLSVAPDVNTSSLGSAPTSAATWVRASSTAASASVPITCSTLCGLP
jgi:hypothetical protein